MMARPALLSSPTQSVFVSQGGQHDLDWAHSSDRGARTVRRESWSVCSRLGMDDVQVISQGAWLVLVRRVARK